MLPLRVEAETFFVQGSKAQHLFRRKLVGAARSVFPTEIFVSGLKLSLSINFFPQTVNKNKEMIQI